MRKKQMVRLQGEQWHALKDKMQLIYIDTITKEGHIKGIYKKNNESYVHWLNNEEIEQLKKQKII